MPVGTINPPVSHAQVFGTVGFDYVFAEQEILLELQDTLDVMGLGVVPLRGDLVGSGSDTVRVTDLGDVGFSLPFVQLFSETDRVAPSPLQLGFETITIGQFGLSHSETYKQQSLNRESGISLDALKARVPQSWARTFRDRVTLAGSAIPTAVGSAGTPLDVDDHLDLATAYKVNLGSRRPIAMIDGTQFDQLSRSYRTEPAFTNSAAEFAEVLGLVTDTNGRVAQIRPNFGGMGIDLGITDSIVQSGGARQGFAFPPGGIGWAVASSSPIRPANQNGAIYVPQMGLFIEELTEGGGQTKRQFRATTFFGVALGSERVFTLRRFISSV